jgi:aspartate/methionine/tyrosine aminotransferase
MPSRRTAFDRTPNAFAYALDHARARGLPLVDLTASNPTTVGLEVSESAVLEPLRRIDALTYRPEPFGPAETRQAVARAIGADPRRVVLTASTSEAYSFLFTLLADPGDRIGVPRPSYPLLDTLARLAGTTLETYPLRYDGRWHLDDSSLSAARERPPAAIVAVHPNHPTGSYLDDRDLECLRAIGRPLIFDEVFATYPLDDTARDPRPIASRLEDGLAFSLGGLSKLVALPQMKVGWIVVGGEPAEVDEALARLEVIADAFLSASAPALLATPAWLDAGRTVRDALHARLRVNLAAARACLDDTSAVTMLPVEGGWNLVLRVPRVKTDEAWTERFLEAGVVVHPGWLYDFDEDGFVVVSLLPDEASFARGIAALANAVRRAVA